MSAKINAEICCMPPGDLPDATRYGIHAKTRIAAHALSEVFST
jgi:hypothetical protein